MDDVDLEKGVVRYSHALHRLPAADAGHGWSGRVAPLADLGEMTRMWAVEKFIGHWDGYAGGWRTGTSGRRAPGGRDGIGRIRRRPWRAGVRDGGRGPIGPATGGAPCGGSAAVLDDVLGEAAEGGEVQMAPTMAPDLDGSQRPRAANRLTWKNSGRGDRI